MSELTLIEKRVPGDPALPDLHIGSKLINRIVGLFQKAKEVHNTKNAELLQLPDGWRSGATGQFDPLYFSTRVNL